MHPLFHPLFVEYCAYFNGNKDYFECHEVLEEYWKEIAPGEKLHPLVGYVQLATSLYHWRRSNFSGAERTLQKAITNFKQNNGNAFFDLIDMPVLLDNMELTLNSIKRHATFQEFPLPITADQLRQLVNDKSAQVTGLSTHFIENKHLLRDRTEILTARELKKRSRH